MCVGKPDAISSLINPLSLGTGALQGERKEGCIKYPVPVPTSAILTSLSFLIGIRG